MTYHSCTKVAHHSEWCSLTPVYSGKWANCGKENTHDTKPVFHNFHIIVKVLSSKFKVAVSICFKQPEVSLCHDVERHKKELPYSSIPYKYVQLVQEVFEFFQDLFA